MHLITEYLNQHLGSAGQMWLVPTVLLCGIAVAAVAGYYVARWVLWAVQKAVGHTPTQWDDDLINSRFSAAVSQLAPAMIVSWLLPEFFGESRQQVHWLSVLTSFYILWAIVRIVIIFIDNLYAAMRRRDTTSPYAIKGVFQMFKLIFIGIGVIVGLSLLIGKTPLAILGALGAAATVLMLVFKDTILGLVASVQLTANKMLEPGDWIKCDSHGANGTVEDVSLTTVKVRNFDNTITTVPPYALISESFQNYQAMVRSGGRRVSRAVFIDANTVRFLTQPELAALADEGFVDAAVAAGNEPQVNLRLLRDYMEQRLKADPRVRPDLTLMVRQLDPTPNGLPVELYFFTRTTQWVEYEHIQGDIFNHLYATIARFGLRIYQAPAGSDISSLRTTLPREL